VAPDVRHLVRACQDVHDRREVWERLSGAGRSAVARSHSRSVYLDGLETVYEEAIACAF
jgi:hypothetical protein